MAIPSGILDYPDIGRLPNTLTFSLMYNTTVFQSPIGGSTQTLEVPGAYWKGTVTYNNLTVDEAAILNAFLVKCRGRSGRFWFGNLSYDGPRHTNSLVTTATLNAVSNNRITLRTTAWPSNLGNQELAARQGDYVAVRYKYNNSDTTQSLHMLTQDLRILNVHTASATVEPPLRRPYSSTFNLNGGNAYLAINTNAAIGYQNAVSIFRLDSDDINWSTRPPKLQSIQFSVVEAFDGE